MNSNNLSNANNILFKFLGDLNKGSNLIIQAFNNNLDNVDDKDFDLLELLKKQDIIFSAFDGYRLNPMLARLFNSILDIDRSRHIEVGLAKYLDDLKRIIDRYFYHKSTHHNEIAEETLKDIENFVFEIIFEAKKSIKTLGNRVQTQFGFVRSLDDKISENEHAIEIASELVDNLTLFNFETMMGFVQRDDDTILYRILCLHLLPELTKCQNQLNGILINLKSLLAKFRKEVIQTNVLKAFCQHHYTNLNYLPRDYSSEPIPHELFLKTTALKISTHPDLENDNHTNILEEIIANLQNPKDKIEVVVENSQSEGSTEPPKVLTEEYQYEETEEDLIIFFKHIISSDKSISAKEYHQNNQLKYRLTHWLFAVAAYYEDMPEQNKMYFKKPNFLGTLQYTHPLNKNIGFGDSILEDIELETIDNLKNKV
ncbi:MAG: hypothetical protein ACI4V7_12475 [Succinivibrionaceae bacterium]